MATWCEKDRKIIDIIEDNRDLAQAQTGSVQAYLERVQAEIDALPLTIVNTTIGTSITPVWTATIADPASVNEPTFLQDLIDALPTTWPTLPTISYTPPAFSETIPTAVRGTFTGNVLGASYWADLQAQADASIALELAAKLRMSRNRGAGSWMAMPSEAVLVGARVANDDATRAKADARSKIALERAKQGREDFWEAVKSDISRYSAATAGYAQIVEPALKAALFPLEVPKLETEIIKVQFEALSPAASGLKALMESRVAVAQLGVSTDVAQVNHDKLKNDLSVQRATLDQAAQEAKAKLDVVQAQWVSGQRNDLLRTMTSTASGLATASLAASNVGLSTSLSSSKGYSISASQNAGLEWAYVSTCDE